MKTRIKKVKFKVQLIEFQRVEGGAWEKGIGFMDCGFGCSSISAVIDSKGKPVDSKSGLDGIVWDYRLLEGLGCYITSDAPIG